MGWYSGTQYDITVPPDVRRMLRQRAIYESIQQSKKETQLRTKLEGGSKIPEQVQPITQVQSEPSEELLPQSEEELRYQQAKRRSEESMTINDDRRSAKNLELINRYRAINRLRGTGRFKQLEQLRRKAEAQKTLSSDRTMGPPI